MSGDSTTLEQVLDLSQRLTPVEQLELIGVLSERLREAVEGTGGGQSVDMLSLAGLGAELWQEIDVDHYLRRECESWDR